MERAGNGVISDPDGNARGQAARKGPWFAGMNCEGRAGAGIGFPDERPLKQGRDVNPVARGDGPVGDRTAVDPAVERIGFEREPVRQLKRNRGPDGVAPRLRRGRSEVGVRILAAARFEVVR